MQVIEKFWMNNIAIIVVETEVGERKAYVGTCGGDSDVYDVQQIIMHGTPIHVSMLESILKVLKGGKTYEGKGRN